MTAEQFRVDSSTIARIEKVACTDKFGNELLSQEITFVGDGTSPIADINQAGDLRMKVFKLHDTLLPSKKRVREVQDI